MENWEAFTQVASRLTTTVVLVGVLWLLVTDKYVWTKSRGLEWKERALDAEKRAREAELELRENTVTLKSLTEKAEEGNKTQAEILKALLSEKR